MNTTLNKLKSHKPCKEGWEKLLKALGKTEADDEPIELSFILESNGYDDALWALRAVGGYEKEMRLFAVWCARQVQHLITDERSIQALDIAERYANGQATESELTASRDAAWDAARYAARYAAWNAAWNATWDAARNAQNAARNAQIEQFKKLIAL